jgi:RNA polymerase subunit RPABC4/transcription elongation factor Spt4
MARGWCVRCGEPWPEDKGACGTCGAAAEEQKQCKSCGHFLQGAMKFCPDCGSFTDTKRECSQCAKPMHASMKFCPGCGGKAREVSLTPRATGLLGSKIEAAAQMDDIVRVVSDVLAPKPAPALAPATAAAPAPIAAHGPVRSAAQPAPASPAPAPGRPDEMPSSVPADPRSAAIQSITAASGISFLRAKRLVDMGYDLPRLRGATLGDLTRIPGFDEWSARQVLEGTGAKGHPLPDSVDRYEKTLTEVTELKTRFAKVSSDVSAVETMMQQAMDLRAQSKVEWAVQVILEARSHLVLKINAYVAYTREKIQARAAQPDVTADTKEKLKRLYFYLDTAVSFRDHTRAVGLCAVAQTLTSGA